jgi:hypothetical protein
MYICSSYQTEHKLRNKFTKHRPRLPRKEPDMEAEVSRISLDEMLETSTDGDKARQGPVSSPLPQMGILYIHI